MVVWDLDEVLWAGTLNEGAVQLKPAAASAVRALNRRGIVNSICSRNDRDQVRGVLEDLALWEEFVFASIDWAPKGERLAQLIDDAQLRPVNVLFIDDLLHNLEEASYAAPGLQTSGPEIIDGLLDLPQCAGKDDPGRTRLEHYRLLERKQTDRRQATGTHEAFLRTCGIRVRLGADAPAVADRLYELVTRTNQLNFTKRRPGRPEFEAMLGDPAVESGFVQVADRYGDYGICGFFSRDRDSGRLRDFLFSCRILDMGVEQWLFEHLGRPAFESERGGPPPLGSHPDWITLVEEGLPEQVPGAPPERHGADGPVAERRRRVVMMGGCDLWVVFDFLGGDITKDFARSAKSGALMHVEHTQILRQARAGLTADQERIVEQLPVVDLDVFSDRPVFADDYGVLVYSVLMDYSQAVYVHRASGLVLPWEQLEVDVTARDQWPTIQEKYRSAGVDQAFLEWFADEFERRGPMSPEEFAADIGWLCEAVDPGVRVVFLNGAEVAIDDPAEPGRHERHRVMNRALAEVVETKPNASICDVRAFVRSPDDVGSNLRHYRRHVYLRIANELRDRVTVGLEPPAQAPWRRRSRRWRRRKVRQARGLAARSVRRVQSTWRRREVS